MRCKVNQLNGQSLGRGAGYIFIETVIGFISGYLLWLILARLTTPEIIGTSSAVVSLASIFTTVAALGVPTGVSRFLARFFHEKDLESATIFVKVSLILTCIGIFSSVTILWIIKNSINSSLDPLLIISAMLLIGSSSIGNLLVSIVIASLKTRILPKVMVVASCFRIVMVIILVLGHTGALGIVMGYSIFQIIVSILLTFTILGLLKRQVKKPTEKTNNTFKSILNASVPSWIPKLITVFGGANFGTVIVFGSSGSSEAASYFLASTIFSGILATVGPLYTIAYPALSAMSDNRKRFTWRIMKISMIILCPLSISFIFYSHDVINLFGQHYRDASSILRILLLAAIMGSVSTMVLQLVYAYGKYRQILYLGLASSIPTTVLYFVLVPLFGSTGAATSYLIGSVTTFVLSSILARKIGVIIYWKDLSLIVILPLLPAFLFSYFQLNFILGIISTIATSIIAYLRFKILSKSDVEDGLNVLPKGLAGPLSNIFNKVGNFLNKDYQIDM
jgi:O-antigen/teichoic acid export membrane protein